MLTPEQKVCRQQFSEENLDMPRANPENFSKIITGDETLVHHHDPETKQVHPMEISGATNTRKDRGKSFLGLRRCFSFGIHATQDNHYWRHLCFHNGGFTREYQTETPWKVFGWCPAAS